MTRYCITWGEAYISTILWANSKPEAIDKFVSGMRKEWGEDFEPNIKNVNIIK